MQTRSIAASTGMGAVEIAVTDADRALRFYRDYVGLTEIPSEDSTVRMGAHGRELVVLHPGAERPVVPRTSGLYHLAILVPDRRELARVIGRLAALRWEQYPTDHVMTKANYLWDPDGNGIEIYTESPEDGTMGFANNTFAAWDKYGNPRSGRDPIDLDELFSHLREDAKLDVPMPEGTKMGHVHLHVANVEDALRGRQRPGRTRALHGPRARRGLRIGGRLPPPPRPQHVGGPRRQAGSRRIVRASPFHGRAAVEA